MLNGRNKKSIEKRHFAYFKELCKEFPSSDHIEHDDNPDFLIEHSLGVLGVEHTQLFKITKHPNAPQALESFRQQIVDSAKKFCEKDIPPLFVNVWFNFNQVVPKNRTSEINRISKSLANMVKKWYHENPSKTYETLKPSSEISEIYQMIITTAWNGKTGLTYHLWTVEGPAVVQNLTIEKIQSCINKKNRRYKEYIKKCGECWLLIVADIFRNSQSFEIPDRIDQRFESKFEKVFYMDSSHRKDLRELPINRLKSFP